MQRPRIGELNKRVQIRAWQDVPGPDQGITPTYDVGVPAWARIEPTGSALFYGLQQVEPGVTHRLAAWRTAQVNADVIGGSHVVDHGRMRYRVRRATDMNGGGVFVLLDLEQLGEIKP